MADASTEIQKIFYKEPRNPGEIELDTAASCVFCSWLPGFLINNPYSFSNLRKSAQSVDKLEFETRKSRSGKFQSFLLTWLYANFTQHPLPSRVISTLSFCDVRNRSVCFDCSSVLLCKESTFCGRAGRRFAV
jgi:hypothetical protein